MDNTVGMIVRETLLDGERFVLPRRPVTGGAVIAGMVLLGMGGFGVLFSIVWILGASGAFSGEVSILGLIFALFGLPFLAAAMIPVALGLFFLRGRTEIVIAGGQLRSIERAGPFRWSFRREVAQVRQLNVGVSLAMKRQFEQMSGTAGGAMRLQREINARLGGRHAAAEHGRAIQVTFDDAKPIYIAPGYPQPLLEELASLLSERMGVLAGRRAAIEVTDAATLDEPADEPIDEGVPEKPADSPIVVEERADGITLTIPPAGVWKGSKGLMGFSMLWLGFMVVFTGGFFFASGDKPRDEQWVFWLLLPLFWAVGLGMMFGAIVSGKRMAVIDIVEGALLITRRGPLGTKQWQWTADELASIHVGDSGMRVNNVPVLQLQVEPRAGKKVGLLSGRDLGELEWLAAYLSDATGLRGAAAEQPE